MTVTASGFGTAMALQRMVEAGRPTNSAQAVSPVTKPLRWPLWKRVLDALGGKIDNTSVGPVSACDLIVLLAGAEPIDRMEMSTDTTNELHTALEQKTRDDLHIIARRLRIQGYRRLNRPDLIAAILDTSDKSKLARSLSVSWWGKYHNHVYGAAGVLSVILTVLFFVLSYPLFDRDNQSAANEGSRSPVARVQSRPPNNDGGNPDLSGDSPSVDASCGNVSIITLREYIDEHKRRENLTSLQKEQFFKHYVGKQVNWIGYVRGVEERGDDVVITIEPERESGMFDVARCEVLNADKSRFMTLSKGQKLRATGTLTDRFFYGYVVNDCEVTQIWALSDSLSGEKSADVTTDPDAGPEPPIRPD